MKVWLRALGIPLPIAATCGLENTQGKGKIKLYTVHFIPTLTDRKI